MRNFSRIHIFMNIIRKMHLRKASFCLLKILTSVVPYTFLHVICNFVFSYYSGSGFYKPFFTNFIFINIDLSTSQQVADLDFAFCNGKVNDKELARLRFKYHKI